MTISDVQGNLNALSAGANVLFVDMLPKEFVKDFNIINTRMIEGMEKVNKLAEFSEMKYF